MCSIVSRRVAVVVIICFATSIIMPSYLFADGYDEAYEAGRQNAQAEIDETEDDFQDDFLTGAAIVGGAVVVYFLVKMAIGWSKNRSSASLEGNPTRAELSELGEIPLGDHWVSFGLSLEPSRSLQENALAIESPSDIQPTLTLSAAW